MKQKKMSPTKTIKNLRDIDELIQTGMIRAGVIEHREAIKRAISMVKDHRKVFLDGIDDEFGGVR